MAELYLPKPMTQERKLNIMKHGGRKRGLGHGSYIMDLVALRKTILLCGKCQHQFDWKRHGYRSIWRYEHMSVQGQCDACRAMCRMDGRCYIHEDHFNACWLTQEKDREARQFACVL